MSRVLARWPDDTTLELGFQNTRGYLTSSTLSLRGGPDSVLLDLIVTLGPRGIDSASHVQRSKMEHRAYDEAVGKVSWFVNHALPERVLQFTDALSAARLGVVLSVPGSPDAKAEALAEKRHLAHAGGMNSSRQDELFAAEVIEQLAITSRIVLLGKSTMLSPWPIDNVALVADSQQHSVLQKHLHAWVREHGPASWSLVAGSGIDRVIIGVGRTPAAAVRSSGFLRWPGEEVVPAAPQVPGELVPEVEVSVLLDEVPPFWTGAPDA